MFKRYTLSDVTSNRFYQMPKFLFEGELKSSLSNDAKVLYSLLRDRHELSIKNNWVNENNEVYLIYTREDLCDMLGCTPPTLRKSVEQLKKFNLMDEKRNGFNKPNFIYLNYFDQQTQQTQGVKEFYTPEGKNFTLPTENNFPSGQKENCFQEGKDFSPSNTNLSYTDSSDTDYQSIIPQEHKNDEMIDTIDEIDNRDEVLEIVKENIEYDICKQTKGEVEYIDNIISVMVDVICSTSPTVRVGRQDKQQSVVKSQFLKLNYEHIGYVCLCLSENTTKIKNIKSYLMTSLYNAPQTMDTYYSQRVQHDMKEC